MKKQTFILGLLVLVMLLFAACDGNKSSSGESAAFVGTWKITEITAVDSDKQSSANSFLNFEFTLNSDGTVDIDMEGLPDDATVTTAWKLSSKTITISMSVTYEGETETLALGGTYSISGNTLTLSDAEISTLNDEETDSLECTSIVFTKQ